MYYQYSTEGCIFKPVLLRIRDILVRIRIRIRILGSIPLTNGSDADSEGKNILILRIRIRNTGIFTSFFKDKSHKEVTNLTIFA
jgi:hypothetical protein